MDLSSVAIGLTGLTATGYIMEKLDKNLKLSNCLFDKLLIPVTTVFNKKKSDDTIEILSVNDDHIEVNTQHKTLYALELSAFDTIERHMSDLSISSLYDSASKDKKGYIYQAILKDKNYQKHYVFSYSEEIIKIIAESFELPLLTGLEIVDVIFDLFLENSFYIKNKQLHRQLNIGEDTTVSYLPIEKTFNKVLKNNIFNNLNTVDIYQGYSVKGLNNNSIDYNELFKLDFKGIIWGYYDFNKDRNLAFSENVYDIRKFYGGKEPFAKIVDAVERGSLKQVITNFEIVAKNIPPNTVTEISKNLGVVFTKKKNGLSSTTSKTPLKYRDSRFDMPCNLSFLSGRIATAHKKASKKPDFFGEDKKLAHINYGFAEDNDNPHSILIAPTGSGKSMAKQKIVAQMIDLDVETGYAPKLGLESNKYGIRNFDVGYSDKPTFELIKSNKKNNVGEISGDLDKFKFNVLNLEVGKNGKPLREDLQFATDLISLILESQNMDGRDTNAQKLNTQEVGKFNQIVYWLYSSEFQHYKIASLIEREELYEELKSLGYNDNDKLKDIKESKYDFLKAPLLRDVIKEANIRKSNQQIAETERTAYADLYQKLSDVNNLGYFSDFDNLNIIDTAYIYSELNSLKESSLFVPMFFGIFWKIYIKDRNRATEFKKNKKNLPKLIYLIEESSNHFRFKAFEVMFKKLIYEARKYNIHMLFVIQNDEEVPYEIFKNINTRIFLFPPKQKESIIERVKNVFKAEDKVIEAMKKAKQYELVIWYSKGVINMKLKYTDKELDLFSTDPNEIKK